MANGDRVDVPVELRWGVRIPLRDGVHLSATVYLPSAAGEPLPTILTLTPYIAQSYHDVAVDFAAHGYPFLAVDVRGRGNSEGRFDPLISEACDGYDVVEWVARQPYCNGQVAMWGGSYAGYDQWVTAKEAPPHLATIVPVASPYIGVDFPMRNNVFAPYLMQWLTLVWGRTSQEKLFAANRPFWSSRFRHWFESGVPFQELDSQCGNPSAIFQQWLEHPAQSTDWDRYNPTAEHYASISIPILTITGICDDDQLGALTHYREHLKYASVAARDAHHLIIGPWDHAGTRSPQAEFLGLKCGPASLLDLPKLHREWYAWAMRGGPKPAFLEKRVAYYVLGTEKWRFADTLEDITARTDALYLSSNGDATDVFRSGTLATTPPATSEPDRYVYDPRDIAHASLESTTDPESRVDQRLLLAAAGKQLVYHSAPFVQDTEISGFLRLSVWISIDQLDTDFRAAVYEIGLDGGSVLLSSDWVRARYRESLRQERLIHTRAPLRYDFERFPFTARLVASGHRLRLVIGPINSIYSEKNYNNGGIVSAESISGAHTVTVTLHHDAARPNALFVPIGRLEI